MEYQVVDEVLSLFGKRKRESRVKYRQFVADGVALGKREELGGGRRISRVVLEEPGAEKYDARILGGSAFIEELRTRKGLEEHLPQPLELTAVVARVCNHFGVNDDELRGHGRAARIAEVRSLICYLAVRRQGHSGVEVGRQVNLGRAGVSVAAVRGEKMVLNDPELLKLIDK